LNTTIKSVDTCDKENLEEFWCSVFGHRYRLSGYIGVAAGNNYWKNITACEWECLKCGKSTTVVGKVETFNPPKDGKVVF